VSHALPMNKRALLDTIIAALKAEFDTLTNAARDARQSATDEESRAEDKHDTRAIEASYLADGQERAALELAEALKIYRTLEPRSFADGEPVALAALVELEIGRQHELYFLGPSRGGLIISQDGHEVLVITPASPIGKKLLGRRAGDAIKFDGPRLPREGKIVAVQ
jgi:transcription elongation GreA/GreB family factor